VQLHPAALPLDLIDLSLAVVLAAGLKSQQLRVSRERLEGCQHVSHGHAPSVATTARYVSTGFEPAAMAVRVAVH
jgi:hypothetical protein